MHDGHGAEGHHVSNFVASKLLEEIENNIMNPKSRWARRNSVEYIDFIINPNEPDLAAIQGLNSRKSSQKNSSKQNLRSSNLTNTLSSFEIEENSNIDSESSAPKTRNLLKRK